VVYLVSKSAGGGFVFAAPEAPFPSPPIAKFSRAECLHFNQRSEAVGSFCVAFLDAEPIPRRRCEFPEYADRSHRSQRRAAPAQAQSQCNGTPSGSTRPPDRSKYHPITPTHPTRRQAENPPPRDTPLRATSPARSPPKCDMPTRTSGQSQRAATSLSRYSGTPGEGRVRVISRTRCAGVASTW
jgi:hypothetical protein